MSILNSLISKVFGSSKITSALDTSSSSSASGAATATPVDIEVVLNALAAKNPEPLDWKHSIVDLLKLVGLDSGLSARKELAAELHYPGDPSDSAAMNIWLHKAVLQKIAANGGKVPADLIH